LVAQTGTNQFLVTGAFCRVDFQAKSGGQREFLRVEEIVNGSLPTKKSTSGLSSRGHNTPVAPEFIRIWNGDETDWGLNFSSAPQVVHVSLGTF
jgi:hypothetical protein